MRIGFDLHFTLATSRVDFWKVAAENIGMQETPEPPKQWGFPEYSNRLSDECKRLFKMNWYMDNMMYFSSEASYLLNTCSLCNHEIFIITACEKEVKVSTERKIRNAFGSMIKHVVFSEPNSIKVPEMSQCKLDVWVDDNAKDCHYAVKHGVRTIMVNQPWNQKFFSDETSNKIKRVDDLNGVVKYLNILPGFRKSGV